MIDDTELTNRLQGLREVIEGNWTSLTLRINELESRIAKLEHPNTENIEGSKT